MPQILRIGPYSIYFWSNENDPLEPVHVHISEGRATPNGKNSGSQARVKSFCAIIIPKFQIMFSKN